MSVNINFIIYINLINRNAEYLICICLAFYLPLRVCMDERLSLAYCYAHVDKIASMEKWLNVLVSTLQFIYNICALLVAEPKHGNSFSKTQRRWQMFGIYLYSVFERKLRANGEYFILSLAAAYGLFVVMSFFLFAILFLILVKWFPLFGWRCCRFRHFFSSILFIKCQRTNEFNAKSLSCIGMLQWWETILMN